MKTNGENTRRSTSNFAIPHLKKPPEEINKFGLDAPIKNYMGMLKDKGKFKP